jgi:hypothetical protein
VDLRGGVGFRLGCVCASANRFLGPASLPNRVTVFNHRPQSKTTRHCSNNHRPLRSVKRGLNGRRKQGYLIGSLCPPLLREEKRKSFTPTTMDNSDEPLARRAKAFPRAKSNFATNQTSGRKRSVPLSHFASHATHIWCAQPVSPRTAVPCRAAPVSSTHANKQKSTRPTSFPQPRPSFHFPLASPPLLRRHRQQAPCGRCPVPRRSDAARSTVQRCGGSAAVGSTGSPTWATETATIMDARGAPTSSPPLPLHPSAACLLRRSRSLLMSRRRLLPSVTAPGAGGTRDGYTRTAPHPASPPAGAGTATTAAWSRTLSSPSPRSSSSR